MLNSIGGLDLLGTRESNQMRRPGLVSGHHAIIERAVMMLHQATGGVGVRHLGKRHDGGREGVVREVVVVVVVEVVVREEGRRGEGGGADEDGELLLGLGEAALDLAEAALEEADVGDAAVDGVLEARRGLVGQRGHGILAPLGGDVLQQLADVAGSEHAVHARELLRLLRREVRREDALRRALPPQKLARRARRRRARHCPIRSTAPLLKQKNSRHEATPRLRVRVS